MNMKVSAPVFSVLMLRPPAHCCRAPLSRVRRQSLRCRSTGGSNLDAFAHHRWLRWERASGQRARQAFGSP